MHEVKGTAKLRGGSYFLRRSHRTAKDHFRRVYYGTLDLIVSVGGDEGSRTSEEAFFFIFFFIFIYLFIFFQFSISLFKQNHNTLKEIEISK